MKSGLLAVAACAAPIAFACPAFAAPPAKPGDPIKVSDTVSIDPIVDGRLRYERVEQPTTDADALTMRLRAGVEVRHASGLSFLAEGEGTLGMVNDYNAFPFAIADRQRRTQFAVVTDPMNVELNRLQLQYKGKGVTVTIGRQRINLDDQRFVGSVGWRQNEQTFDAVRGEAKLGPIALDATYSNSQRTIFGVDAGPRQSLDGDFILAGAGVKLGPVNLKGFAYLLDYDEAFYVANSSQTYGVRATGSFPLGQTVALNLAGSYARQTDYQANPFDYAADYIAGEAGLAVRAFTLTGGYELLGGDNGRAFQTPLATLHKFNGWADLFLTTPQTPTYGGLQDLYAGAAYKFDGIKALPGLNAAVAYHRFDSDYGNMKYGTEWDASMGVKVGQFGVLAKYADYDASGFGVNTRKFWLQAEFAY